MNVTDLDDSELSARAAVNRKEFHYHGANGSQKIVWAWAVGSSALVCTIIGSIAMYFANQQAQTNQRVADAITALSVKVGEQGADLRSVQGTLVRLETKVDEKR